MFKHKKSPTPETTVGQTSDSGKLTVEEKVFAAGRPTQRDSSADLRELMEKNLKWSQIIYEQNRRINSKLFWNSFFSWFKIIIFLAVTALGALYLSPFVKQGVAVYNALAGQYGDSYQIKEPGTSSFDDLVKLLPINDAQREQLKQLFNKK